MTDQLKNTLLFSLLGTEGLRQFRSNPIVTKMNEAAMTHAIFKAAVTKFLQCPTSIPCACLDFRLCHQGASESASEFVVALRELAPDCQFSDDFPEELAMQLIAGCHSPKARERMLMQNLDLDEYLKILDMDEAVRGDSAAFSATVGESTESPCANVWKVLSGRPAMKSTNAPTSCFNCGRSGHVTSNWSCPARNTHCCFCHGRGHWEVVCQTKYRTAMVNKTAAAACLAAPEAE